MNTVKEHALQYLKRGFSIIPVGQDKKPLLPSWKEFQTRRPTPAEIEEWFREYNPPGIAIITGKISGLVVLDVEANVDLTPYRIPLTVAARTGGGGWHFYFRYPKSLQIGNVPRIKSLMDLKSDGGYVVAPPSLHSSGRRYEWSVGFDVENPADIPEWILHAAPEKQPAPEVETLLDGVPQGQRNESAASVAGKFLVHFPETDWERVGWPALAGWNKRNTPPLPEKELRSVWESIKRAERARRNALAAKPQTLPREISRERRGTAVSTVTLPDGLAEMVYDPEDKQTRFAAWRNGEITYEPQLRVNGKLLVRPYSEDNSLICNEIVRLPARAEPYGTENALVADIRRFIHRYVDLNPLFEQLAAYYVLFSWLYDNFNELPYLRVKGDTGSGKTRFLMTVGSLCYKTTFASGASTVSPLFRILDLFRGTLVIDEGDFRYSDEKAEVVKILNNGNARGFPVLRSEAVGSQREFSPRAYQVFGPKIVATRGVFQDRALESRCLTEELDNRKLRADIQLNLDEAFHTEARALRNKLLTFRFAHAGKVKADQSLADPAIEPRLNQVFIPLMSVIQDAKVRAELKTLLHEYQRQLIADRGLDTEAHVVEAIRDVRQPGKEIALKAITERFIAQHGDEMERKVTAKWIGGIIRRRLGLRTLQTGGKYVIPASETPKIAQLCAKYGIGLEPLLPADGFSWDS